MPSRKRWILKSNRKGRFFVYLLLIALGIIIFIHSLLLMTIIQKNTEMTKKIAQLEKRNSLSKSSGQRQFPNERKTKLTKRGSR